MRVLVIDVGGTSVKILASGQQEPRKFESGPSMTVAQMVSGVKEAAAVYRRVVGIQNLGMQLDELFAAIDRSAPGSVPRRPTPAPVPPVRIPEP